MRLALFIAAALCLAGAAGFALAPVDAPAVSFEDAPLRAPPPRGARPRRRSRAPALRRWRRRRPVTLPLVISGRVNPSSGVQPEVHLVLQAQCGPGIEDCDAEQIDVDADPATGEFSAVVYPATWRIVARAEGFLPASEEGLQIADGEELGDIVMTLERGERITGTVVFEGAPAADVPVLATGEGYTRVGMTDELGTFAIEGLPRGTFTVVALAEPSGGDEKVAATGSSVHLSLAHRLKVRGRVLDQRGFPVEGADIFSDYAAMTETESDPFPSAARTAIGLGLHGCGPSPGCYHRGVTDAAGRFELSAAPGETLVISARKDARSAELTDVAPGGEVELTLQAGHRLRLLDEAGNPAAFTELQADPPPLFFAEMPQTGADGWFTLPPSAARLQLPRGTRLEGALPDGVQLGQPLEDLVY